MDATTTVDQERTEVELVFQSGVFDKAPRLGHFFRYICERHFEGRADEIKEYSIAVEALSRGVDFDPKKDSIVRVEAHRLRKRLEEYYRGAGADHPIQVVIPNGQYRPQFITRDQALQVTAAQNGKGKPGVSGLQVVNLPDLKPPPEDGEKKRAAARNPRFWIKLAAAFGLLAAVGFFIIRHQLSQSKAPQQTAATDQRGADAWDAAGSDRVVRPAGGELRILAGYRGPLYIDRQGHIWNSDAYFRGGYGKPIPADQFIEAQPDPHLLRSTRFGQFRYDIPLPQGTYELHLYFAETVYGHGNPLGGGEGTRTFSITVNGKTEFSLFDPLAQAGAPNRLHEQVMKDVTPAPDGVLHLQFDPAGMAPAMLSALEILPSERGRVHPVRMVAQSNPVTDSEGRLWAADEYVIGGTQVLRDNVLLNPKERALYQGERYGNFSYRIPLAPGKYRLILHFAEQWFGTPPAQTNALDYRDFDVYANRRALLKDFHVGREAGGANRSIQRQFDNLEPDAQGILLLEFVPLRNYAEVNAIEVIPMP
jgi:hypothetical protein